MSHSEKVVRKKLEDRLGHKLGAAAWGHVAGEVPGLLADWQGDPDAAAADLVEPARRIHETLAKDRASRARATRPSERELGPDARSIARSRIMAAAASQRPSVVSFRSDVLRGRLLKLERHGEWLERRAAEQSRRTRWGRVEIDDQGRPKSRARVSGWENAHLSYAEPPDGWQRLVPVDRDGVLGRLQRVCAGLCREFAWKEWEAVAFVLCGESPPGSRGRWTASAGRFGNDRVTIEVDASTPWAAVREMYQQARAALPPMGGIPGQAQAIQNKHAALAAFAFERSEGRTWESVLKEWNKVHPEWAYDGQAVKPFRRDARKAFERIMGQSMPWGSSR